ncbi:MAG: DUF3618 domain-containing protein [Pontixanthobacter sp.]
MATYNQDDPDAIERDIKQTQREMSATVDQLSDQLTPRKMLDTVLNKTELGDMDGNDMVDQAKRNPLAIALIGGGLLWLISDKDAKPSALTPSGGKSFGGSGGSDDYSAEWDSHDRYHRGYVEHMSAIEPNDGEDNVTYLGRRNRARANYLMLEQRHDEDEKSFSDRLDQATDKMREQRDNLTSRAGEARRSASRRTRSAASRTANAFYDHPLVGGFIAAAIGAVAGSTVPLSQTERGKLGDAGEEAIEQAKGKARQLAGQAREKKDEMVEKADRKMDEAS